MNHNYFFLAGLPRSGNTLLSALLNQNPDVYCSPLSPLSHHVRELGNTYASSQTSLAIDDWNRISSVIEHIFDSYYFDVQKPTVIDRQKDWIVPEVYCLVENVFSHPFKTIVTTRWLPDMLASLVLSAKKSENNSSILNRQDYYPLKYLPVNDAICQSIMVPDSSVQRLMYGLVYAMLPENKNKFFFVDYDELIDYPEETLNEMYDFLGIKNFKHSFSNIQKLEHNEKDEVFGFKGIHHVESTLLKSNVRATEVLSADTVTRYASMDFWTSKVRKYLGVNNV